MAFKRTELMSAWKKPISRKSPVVKIKIEQWENVFKG